MIAANISKQTVPFQYAGIVNISLFEAIRTLTRANVELTGDVSGVTYEILGQKSGWSLHFLFPNSNGTLTVKLKGTVQKTDNSEGALENIQETFKYISWRD